MEVALLVAEEPDSELSYSSTAASLAVLAGIAATDAACCAAQGARFRGQDHRQAATLVESVLPDGREAAKSLRALLALKDEAQYGLVDVSRSRLKRAIRNADDLIAFGRRVVNR